ncbi:MAG: hypothetical protein CSB48_10050 [Proteobacteria bacterium]|nr:MAG: hypothetical protein CSB48_10050 [Pseudomonadota bacterium]
MKSLIPSVSAGLLAAIVSASATADLQALADSEMSEVQGQAGLSIELSAQVDIGEVAYQDAGYVAIKDIHLGGIGASMLDNMLITMDIAGPNEVLHRGFSKFAMWADNGLVDAAHQDVAAAIARYSVGGGYGEAFNDGDMVIHIDSLDPGVIAGNNTAQNIAAYQSAIDFGLSVDSVSLTTTGYDVGNGPAGTLMFSDINAEGYLGPVDIVIRNSDATNTISNGAMDVSGAVTEVDAYFRVTDMDLDWDAADVLLVFNFAAMKQLGVRIHNTRGNDYIGEFGFARVSAKFAAGTSNVSPGVTGLAVYDVEIRADVDMPHVQFGSSPSIGGIYFTDFVFQTDVLVYGH